MSKKTNHQYGQHLFMYKIKDLIVGINNLLACKRKLSRREIEVLSGWVLGKNREQMAKLFGIAVNTISTYKERIKKKLNCKFTFDVFVIAAKAENKVALENFYLLIYKIYAKVD